MLIFGNNLSTHVDTTSDNIKNELRFIKLQIQGGWEHSFNHLKSSKK